MGLTGHDVRNVMRDQRSLTYHASRFMLDPHEILKTQIIEYP